MKRSICVALLSLLLAVASYGAAGTTPPGGTDIVDPVVPQACLTPSDWTAAKTCLNTLVSQFPGIFPGAVIGVQPDDGAVSVYAAGAGFTNDSVVSLASVSKPLVYVGLVKLVQDHYASPACTPMTANCVFPKKFETTLWDALTKLDALRGTRVVKDWFEPIKFDDPVDPQDPTNNQAQWKKEITIQHIAQMTSGFPPMLFTGQRAFCSGNDCPMTLPPDMCNLNDVDENKRNSCRQARLYNQYLLRLGVAVPNGCRPRPTSGERVFDFVHYYYGNVADSDKLLRKFERRYSHQPGITGECVLRADSLGSLAWVDSRTVRESDIAKFHLGMPLITRPGKKYHYSQPNLYVAALLIESVSGQRFDDYLDAKLFTPLNMNDTSFAVRPGTTQYPRLADIKRVPRTPARTLPDLASPLHLDTTYGADKNWDEPRDRWSNRWPEGGAYSTATDLLAFLKFIRTGKTPSGAVLLNTDSLKLLFTKDASSVDATRTYAFANRTDGVYAANGYFATMMRRNTKTCTNVTVLPQIVIENTEFDVQLPDYQYADVLKLRGALVQMLEGIRTDTPCSPASPLEP